MTVLLDATRPADVIEAADVLRRGGTVVIPTDTVYGLAASVFQPQAIEAVYAAKMRAPERRVPVLLAGAADLPILARSVSDAAWALINAFWPGPLTLVLPARPSAPRAITQGRGTVALRVPAARSALRLLEVLGEPVVGTSANVSGTPAARTAAEALAALDGRVDAVLGDDSVVTGGMPSTVVEIAPDGPVVHRQGAVALDAIRRVIGGRILVRDDGAGLPDSLK